MRRSSLLLIALAIGLVIAFAISQRNAVKVAYVNGLPEYNHLPNREYIFQKDCYIFKFTERDSSYPYVSTHDRVPALPAVVSEDKLGQTLPEVRLLGIARVGDRFRIVSVRRDESRSGVRITLEIMFFDEAERNYPRLDAYWILDHAVDGTQQAPVILPAYAVPRVTL